MSNRLWIAIIGSIVIHIGAYLFLMELDPDVTKHKKNWEVYTKKKVPKKKKIKFKPKKKKVKKKIEKKAPPKPKPKPRKPKINKPKPKPMAPMKARPQKIDFTKVGLSGNSFGGNGIALPLGDTTLGDPDAEKPKPKPVMKVVMAVVVEKPKPKIKVVVKSLPKALSVPRFAYPQAAKDKGIQGTVKLLVTIGRSGKVISVKIIKGLGHGLDKLAVKALKGAKFKPAYGSDGKPMVYTIRYRYRFTLEED